MPDIEAIARQFIEALPHSRALGMRLEAITEGSATIAMPYDTRLIGDPATGVLHGGVDDGHFELLRPARHAVCKLPFAVWMALCKAAPLRSQSAFRTAR